MVDAGNEDDDEEHQMFEVIEVPDDQVGIEDSSVKLEENEAIDNFYEDLLEGDKSFEDNQGDCESIRIELEPDIDSDPNSTFQCDICKQHFRTRNCLEKHIHTHSRKKVYTHLN